MKKQEEIEVRYVKLSTMLLIAFLCLLAGFIGGNIYSVYKGGDSGSAAAFSPFQNPSGSPSAAQKNQKIKALEDIVKSDPDNSSAWLDLGNAYFDMDKPKDAIRAYKEYLKRIPDDPNGWTDMGVMYRRNGQSAQALDAFDKAISLNPLHQQSRFNKGIVLLHDMKDPQAALKAWKELEKINPNFTAPNGQPLRDLIATVKAPQ